MGPKFGRRNGQVPVIGSGYNEYPSGIWLLNESAGGRPRSVGHLVKRLNCRRGAARPARCSDRPIKEWLTEESVPIRNFGLSVRLSVVRTHESLAAGRHLPDDLDLPTFEKNTATA